MRYMRSDFRHIPVYKVRLVSCRTGCTMYINLINYLVTITYYIITLIHL